MCEITEELFYQIINSGDRNSGIDDHLLYTDVIYYKFGMKLVYRSQNGYTNYYIEDINK